MPYTKYNDYQDWSDSVYTGKYQGRNAFIHVANKKVTRIVLDDATHLYGQSLWCLNHDEILIEIVEAPTPIVDETAIKEKQRIINEQWKRINEYAANEDENKRDKIIAERILSEKQERHNAQLRAVFYMLEELEILGTHREKAIAINHIRRCIHKYLKDDGLDKYGYPSDLPF